MQKTIYLMRHGETDYNLKGIVQGSKIDADLNDTGRIQAHKFFEKYGAIPFDKIYISKLKRTYQSVEEFIKKGISWEAYEGLNEISWGDQDGVAHSNGFSEYFHHVSKEWAAGNLSLKVGGGESPLDVLERQKPVVEIILNRNEEKNILICMHGRAIRILLCYLTKRNLSEMDLFEHHNTSLYLMEYDGSSITIKSQNDIVHLG